MQVSVGGGKATTTIVGATTMVAVVVTGEPAGIVSQDLEPARGESGAVNTPLKGMAVEVAVGGWG